MTDTNNTHGAALLPDLAAEIARKIARVHPTHHKSKIPVTIKVSRTYAEMQKLVTALQSHSLPGDVGTVALQNCIGSILKVIEPLLRFHETGGHEGDGSDKQLNKIRAVLRTPIGKLPAALPATHRQEYDGEAVRIAKSLLLVIDGIEAHCRNDAGLKGEDHADDGRRVRHAANLAAESARQALAALAHPAQATPSASPENEPVAYMRRWAFDGDEGTRGNRPRGWKLLAVTQTKALPDDVPLFATPSAVSGDAGEEQ